MDGRSGMWPVPSCSRYIRSPRSSSINLSLNFQLRKRQIRRDKVGKRRVARGGGKGKYTGAVCWGREGKEMGLADKKYEWWNRRKNARNRAGEENMRGRGGK